MKFLLDTHTLLWFANGDKLLSNTARKIIVDTKNNCFVSIASLWEISIKTSLNKLEIDLNLPQLRNKLIDNRIEVLPIEFEELEVLQKLEQHHRDPFDRIIIAQGIANGLTIITKDEHFAKYNVDVVWG